jgi:DHA1 family multidrug resistance protein-like MFS transporter
MSIDFILVNLSMIAWGIGEGAFMYYQPLYLEELGASPLAIGGILGGVGLAITVVHIPAGFLADRIGRRNLMWTAWLMGIVSTGIMAAARTLAVFSVGIILYSLTLFVLAPLNSYITAARNKLTVERAVTLNSAAFFLGGVIGPLLGGFLANRFGLRMIYPISFFIFIISGIVILFIKPQPVEQTVSKPAKELFRNQRFMAFLPLVFFVILTLYFPQPLAPNFLKNQRAITLGTIGILGSVTNLGNVILNLLFGILPSRIGLLLGEIFIGAFSLLVWKTAGMPMLVGAYFFLGGFRASRSLMTAQIQKMVNSANLGLAYGFLETAIGLAMAVAPPIAGALYARNPFLIFRISLLLLIPIMLFTLFRRKTLWNT